MSAHKTHPRQKPQPPRPERDKAKLPAPPSVQSPPVPPSTVVLPVPPSAALQLPANERPATPATPPPAPITPPAKAISEIKEDLPAPVTPAPPSPLIGPVSATAAPPPRAAQNGNGDHHTQKHISQRTPTPPGELSEMFATMRALFAHDRTLGARGDAARCGICYLTFPREQLVYREADGFYACPDCDTALSHTSLPMLRRQRK